MEMEQSVEARRRLRVSYRELIHTATEQRDDFVRDSTRLVKTLDEVADLHMNVQKPREQAVDTELMVVLAGYGVLLAKGLTPGASTVSASDFLTRLKRTYVAGWDDAEAEAPPNPGAFDWAALGAAVGKHFRWAPSSAPHMLGPLDTAVKERKAAQRRPRDEKAPLARPDDVDDALETGTAQAETERAMKAMRRVLRAHPDGVDALALCYNGACFAQTVENLFTLSFLVKDGRVALKRAPGDRGVLVTLAADQPVAEDFRSGRAAAMQFVFRLDVADWEAARGRMPKQPLMPHREPHAETLAATQAATQAQTQRGAAPRAPGLPAGRDARAAGAADDTTPDDILAGNKSTGARKAGPRAGGKKRRALMEDDEGAGASDDDDGAADSDPEVMPVSKRRRE